MNTKKNVIPQVRTYTRYEAESVVMFDCAESPQKRRFRIDRLTSIVPYAVRFVLRNDEERVKKSNKFCSTLNYRHLIAIVAMFASFCANAQEDWHDCKCNTPIYYRVCESGKDYQVKCKFTLNAPIEKCIDIFCNAENHTKWIYNCIESKTLAKDSASGVFRNIIEAPIFMKDREVFVEYKVVRNSDGSVTITNNCLPDYRPRNDKYERITRLKSTYIFYPKGKDSTEVDYFTETGGPTNLPDFLLYIFLCKSTQQTISNLQKFIY